MNTTSAASAVTVTNTGIGTLTITGASLRGVNPEDFSFTLSPPLPVALQPGQAMTFGVRFTPRVIGIRTAIFQVATNVLNSGQSTLLTGNGILPADLAIAISAKATLTTRLFETTSTLTYTITVTNTSVTGAYDANVNAGVPSGTTLISAVASQGSCKLVKLVLGASSANCSLGTLAGGAVATVVVTTSYSGTIPVNKATVTSLLDPNSATTQRRHSDRFRRWSRGRPLARVALNPHVARDRQAFVTPIRQILRSAAFTAVEAAVRRVFAAGRRRARSTFEQPSAAGPMSRKRSPSAGHAGPSAL